MTKWMIETPPHAVGVRADSQWQTVESDYVKVIDGALCFQDVGFQTVLILAPGTWLSVHPDKE